jgi:hypothetical protein
MVFAVMELQSPGTDHRIKGIGGIGKFGKRKRHCGLLLVEVSLETIE